MRYAVAGIVLGLAPLMAVAAEPIQLADNAPTKQRFMSLDSTRSGLSQAKKPAIRSDRDAMSSGYMRIDRARSRPANTASRVVPVGSAAEQRVSRNGPLIIRGTADQNQPVPITSASIAPMAGANADPVLKLFNGEGDVPVGSFRDSLRAGRVVGAGRPGAHAWPLPTNTEQQITSGFGMRDNPFNRGTREFHEGVDIAAAEGTSVLATADGVVTDVSQEGGYGKFVRLQHADGTESQYSHLSLQQARVGQRVGRGQKIGEIGSTGRSTGPHLDYRLTRNGQFVDPMTALGTPLATTTKTASAPISKMRPSTVSSRQILVRTVD